jgi:two-component system cell cycle sensor histidine kinase/response regulator CckA
VLNWDGAFLLFTKQIETMKTLDELSSELPLRSELGGGNILVVDDEGAVRRFAVRVLEHEGFTVVEAKDGLEALEVVQQNDGSFDVVISDIVMPRLNGVELMQALASSHPELPVILMSGYATAALSELGIVAPCSILPKPFPPERLLHEVRRCIKR